MQIRNAVVEYDIKEAAAMLDISPAALKWAVDAEHLQCYYRRGKNDYRFHEASLRANKELLSQDDYRTELLNAFSVSEITTEPDASEADPPSKPSDP
ncbi:MAG: helix-turn-helix domain-containing protein [Candidatus Poribacteria bacterium]|nr:helix-turn-helix domain-containing protein [Candidatus Poribacteria bacterium]